MIHAHFETESADCDGRYSRTNTVIPWSDEEEFDFERRVLTMVADPTPMGGGKLEVTPLEDQAWRLEWSESTEEGFRHVEATICRDESCNTDEPAIQRDHSAEAAGY